MSKSTKGGLVGRRRSALARLEAAYKAFVAAGEDKAAWDTSRNGKPHHHKSHSFAEECNRYEKEIAILKSRLMLA